MQDPVEANSSQSDCGRVLRIDIRRVGHVDQKWSMPRVGTTGEHLEVGSPQHGLGSAGGEDQDLHECLIPRPTSSKPRAFPPMLPCQILGTFLTAVVDDEWGSPFSLSSWAQRSVIGETPTRPTVAAGLLSLSRAC